MHMHGAPMYGSAERNAAGAGLDANGNRPGDDYSQLFLTVAPIAGHLPAKTSQKRTISPERLALLSKLAVKMTEPTVGIDTDNPDIPAGYTYLAQFAAHDLTFNLTPFDEAKGPTNSRQNARHARLVLQTLYGMGPSVHPHLYNSAEIGSSSRGTLRLGQMRSRTSACPVHGDPWIDLPRVPVNAPGCPYDLDGNVERSILVRGRMETLTADSRNDDNIVTGQMTVLLPVLHNALFNRLDEPSINAKLPPHLQDPRLQFRVAWDVVTLTYRRIVFGDLLRRLLDPDVYAFFLKNGPIKPNPEAKRGVPLGFSHAAYRVGHAMVRSGYEMNDGVDDDARTFLSLNENLALGSQRYSQDLPLINDWYVQWSKFFQVGGKVPQPSRRLGPSIVPLLGRNHYFSNNDGADGASLPGGLMYRDLVRGEEEGLATPAALAGHLAEALGGDFNAEAHVKDIENKIVGWLSGAGQRRRKLWRWPAPRRSFSL